MSGSRFPELILEAPVGVSSSDGNKCRRDGERWIVVRRAPLARLPKGRDPTLAPTQIRVTWPPSTATLCP